MRNGSPQLVEVLTGSFERGIRFDVWHGPDRVAEGLTVEDWSLGSDLDSDVKSGGAATIIHESVDGAAWAPSGTRGILSPFAATVEPIVSVSAGAFTEDVSLGQFPVTSVPSAEDFTADGLRRVVTSSRVEIDFSSLDERLRRWGLRSPEHPKSLVSCWEEMRRLSGMPVLESVLDQPIPRSTVWEAKTGGRLEAIQKLASVLGGVPVVDSNGSLTVVPDELGVPVATLTVGEDGTIVDVGSEIDTDGVYNEVVGTFERNDKQRTPFYAVAEQTTGPLRVDGPFGRSTRYYSSDLVYTPTQGQTAVESVLALSMGGQMYDVPVTCHFNPLIEIGDVVNVVRSTDPDAVVLTGQVVSVDLSSAALMSVVVRVRRELR